MDQLYDFKYLVVDNKVLKWIYFKKKYFIYVFGQMVFGNSFIIKYCFLSFEFIVVLRIL